MLSRKRRYYLNRRIKKYPVKLYAAKRLIEVTPAQYQEVVSNEKAAKYLSELQQQAGYSVQLIIPSQES